MKIISLDAAGLAATSPPILLASSLGQDEYRTGTGRV